MRTATSANDPAIRLARPVDVNLAAAVLDVGAIGAALEVLASDLRSLWSSALGHGDFDEITRIIEASHAVHRAVIALRADTLIPAR